MRKCRPLRSCGFDLSLALIPERRKAASLLIEDFLDHQPTGALLLNEVLAQVSEIKMDICMAS